MGKRRENRASVSLPVVVTGLDQNGNPFSQTAQTIDVSRAGARLSGIRCLRGPGEMITIECGSRSARFRVIWIGIPGSSEDGHFGVKSLQPEKRIFKIDPGGLGTDSYVPQPQAPKPSITTASTPKPAWDHSEYRANPRIRCSGTGQIIQPGVAYPIWAKVTDLSLGGCYLELVFTLAQNSPVELKLTVRDHTFTARGTVATSHPGVGVGIRFTRVDDASRNVLIELLQELTVQRRPAGLPGTGDVP